MAASVVFIDAEVSVVDKKIIDLGAVKGVNSVFHSSSLGKFFEFISEADYLCGHNIIHHDLKYIQDNGKIEISAKAIDTLYISPILFPKQPYHSLLKDDKIMTDELNNPVNDCYKAETLFYDELNAFGRLSKNIKEILGSLLKEIPEFSGFFDYINFKSENDNLVKLISKEFSGKICENADISGFIRDYSVELAYALAFINADDSNSIIPRWVMLRYPFVEELIKKLRNTPCKDGCQYCRKSFNINKKLNQYFGYSNFRKYNDEPLQEMAVQAAVDGKSLLAIFPTGGGKSLTFQLPALIDGETVQGLTVVISPLLSLMKDQVDNLYNVGITEAVTINGLLDPIERADALERIKNGSAKLLYISPEMLRSRTIERLLLGRNITRFVIDEAHCFSAWGHDFRVDYMYIGDFIRELQNKKNYKTSIPVSCFTATAKQKVISDICKYFNDKLDLKLEIFATSSTRENLHYNVIYIETEEEKYSTLRRLISQSEGSTIVYVSRRKMTYDLAQKLDKDGFPALPFNGKMDPDEKVSNQEAFMKNEVKVIVATSAFGMGVDKKDVKQVIHYEISGSLEDYIQEAGRAGRDSGIQADCYVLYNDNDLDKHFILLNQTKLSISEIQQVWRAIKSLTKQRPNVRCSPFEIARQAGWESSTIDIETRVKTAIGALENAGYVKRGMNYPQVFATSIVVKSVIEASDIIDKSVYFSDEQRIEAKRIIKSLISNKYKSLAGNHEDENRVDYLADMLGITKENVISCVNLMRQEGILADSKDMFAYIHSSDSENKSSAILEKFSKLESFLLSNLQQDGYDMNLKEINELAHMEKISTSNVKDLRTLIYFHTIKGYVKKETDLFSNVEKFIPSTEKEILMEKFTLRIEICRFILDELFMRGKLVPYSEKEEKRVSFSLVDLYKEYKNMPKLLHITRDATMKDIEEALLYLSKIGAIILDGGFLVIYNSLEINRLITDNRTQYKQEDYRFLDEFYKQKIQQIHIVGEYANLMVKDYEAALQFVQDYFNMDYRKFITKHFKGERRKEINRNITKKKYNELFGELSEIQSEIINDNHSKYIVVTAGPGSGKTRVLVHKLASLLILEDVKHEQLLMLTFSRAAAVEFKKRLLNLIGNSANFVEIKTFHSYCFDILGRIGSLEGSSDVVKIAVEKINKGEIEQGKITKTVLVIDEAQDIDDTEFELILALMRNNVDMRIIAVGDDDQNIYEFRGSNSKHMQSFIDDFGAVKYEMIQNYRSKKNIVNFTNWFSKSIKNRMKTSSIEAVQNDNGIVSITYHRGKYMGEAVVNEIINTKIRGTCCLLTNTNDEAFQMLGLLLRNGVKAKLIQSLDGFRLNDLTEIRFFLKQIDSRLNSPKISVEIWENAKDKLYRYYNESTCLEICKSIIDSFEETSYVKFRSDLDDFIRESGYENFYNNDSNIVYVSTIHKAKGREFDYVYMMLDGNEAKTDDEKRKLYVGMTRAKNSLYIHCNTDLFKKYKMTGISVSEDRKIYDEPSELSMQLSHRDVVLNYFIGKKKMIFNLRSGSKLTVDGDYLCADIKGSLLRVVKFSTACREKIANLKAKGYYPYLAEVRYIVAWKGEDDIEESAVILPNIFFRKFEK